MASLKQDIPLFPPSPVPFFPVWSRTKTVRFYEVNVAISKYHQQSQWFRPRSIPPCRCFSLKSVSLIKRGRRVFTHSTCMHVERSILINRASRDPSFSSENSFPRGFSRPLRLPSDVEKKLLSESVEYRGAELSCVFYISLATEPPGSRLYYEVENFW